MAADNDLSDKRAQRGLECAVVYLDAILREEVQQEKVDVLEPGSLGHSENLPDSDVVLTSRESQCPVSRAYLISMARQFINKSDILQKYVPVRGLVNSSEVMVSEESYDPRIVLILAKADLARSKVAEHSFPTLLKGDGSKGAGIRSLVVTAICGIIVAAATSVFNSHSEIEARRAGEIYSGRRQFLQEAINRLTDAQSDAQKLSLVLRQAEAGGGIKAEDVEFDRDLLDALRKKTTRIMATIQARPQSDLRFVQLRAFYELEALDVCLREVHGEKDGSEELRKWIELNKGKDLSPNQVSQILTEATPAAPCGENFHADVMDDLIYKAAGELWTLADDIKN